MIIMKNWSNIIMKSESQQQLSIVDKSLSGVRQSMDQETNPRPSPEPPSTSNVTMSPCSSSCGRTDILRERCTPQVCHCQNCLNFSSYAECKICCEPLQGNKIQTCTACANLICKNCSSRLASCAFCRTTKPMERNRAIERILDKLQLPCKNARQGCKHLLVGDTRALHEKVCSFTTVQCPLDSSCTWCGPIISIQSHFYDAHQLIIIEECGVSIAIDHFSEKAMAVRGRQYMGCLKCYDQLFFFKITLFKQKLKFFSCRLGYLMKTSTKIYIQNYNIRVDFIVGETVNVTTYFGFEDMCHRCQGEYDIQCVNNHDPHKRDTTKTISNSVKINVCVEQDSQKSFKFKRDSNLKCDSCSNYFSVKFL